ncbi:MAG: FtsX-like permease family protein [Bacteroidetes bacterium]|nr:MAG: FtsX-like permease family protein [Bacteroidota bacterium]
MVRQFLGESLLYTATALLLSLIMARLLLSPFNQLIGREIPFFPDQGFLIYGIFLLAVLLTGLLAGSYPALVLSGFQTIRIIKGSFSQSKEGVWFRRSLVFLQFTISISLIVGTAVVYGQLNYVKNKHLGFQKEQLVVFGLPPDTLLSRRVQSLADELRQQQGVVSVALANSVPSIGFQVSPIAREGDPRDKNTVASIVTCDEHYLPTLGIELVQGRNFLPNSRQDAAESFIVNEAAVNVLNLEEPVGKRIEWRGGAEPRVGTIVGVVKDFHSQSLHTPIMPMVWYMDSSQLGLFAVRIAPGDIQESLKRMDNVWHRFAPDWPFDYTFIDESFSKLYESEARTAGMFGVFAGLAVFVACLGLFGLAAFATEQRTREIGIRKVLGAHPSVLVTLLTGDFLKPVLLANVVALPLAGWIMDKWMADFAYRAGLQLWVFAASAVLVLLIALLTVSLHTLKAALANPVKSLKIE